MTKKYFIIEDENGNEIGREEVVDKEKKSIIEKVMDFPKNFAEKHPKATKHLKYTGTGLLVFGTGLLAYKLGSKNRGESDYDSDDVNYIPESEPTYLPVDDSVESETTETTSEEEATTTE